MVGSNPTEPGPRTVSFGEHHSARAQPGRSRQAALEAKAALPLRY